MDNSRTKNNSYFLTGLWGALKVNGGAWIAYIVIFVLGSFLSPKFFTLSNQMSILRSQSVTMIVAFGMTFVILTGGIDLSVGSFMSLCGCIVAVFLNKTSVPLPLAIAISLLVGVLFGSVNGIFVNYMKLPPFIATLATMNVMRGTSYVVTGGRPVVFKSDAFVRIGAGFIGQLPLPAIYVIVLFIVLWIILNRTRFGRQVYAVGGNMEAARYSGIRIGSILVRSYILSGVLSAFAGIILIARLGSGQPTIGEGSELDAIASCVVGGISMNGGHGTLLGTLLGCLIMGCISNILNLMGVNSFIQLIIKGIIIVVSVFIDVLRSYFRVK